MAGEGGSPETGTADLIPVVSPRVQPVPHQAPHDSSSLPSRRGLPGRDRGAMSGVTCLQSVSCRKEVPEENPGELPCPSSFPECPASPWSETRGCLQKNTERNKFSSGGFGEEQQLRGAQRQLDLVNCGILGKSLPSQDPRHARQEAPNLAAVGLRCFQF